MAASGRMLESWKEIADHCGRSVRTVQRWARRGLPVYRDAGGTSDRVYAFAEEIDAWRLAQALAAGGNGNGDLARAGGAGAAGTAPPDTVTTLSAAAPPEAAGAAPSQRGSRAWGRAVALALGVLIITAVGIALTRRTDDPGPPRLSRVLAEGDTVVGLDAAGRRLWATRLPGPVATETSEFLTSNAGVCGGRQFELADLEGDGVAEVIAKVRTIRTTGELFCLEEDGRIRWRYEPGETMRFGGRTISAEWFVRFFHLHDVDGDGRREIILTAAHYQLFPAKMVVLDAGGAVRGRYVHTGHFLNMALTDLNRDGRSEILTVGINNAHRQGFLALLDPEDLAGVSPPSGDPAYTCPDLPTGRELGYLLFPRDCINRATHEYGGLDSIAVEQDQVVVATFRTMNPPEGVTTGSVLYYLDRRLALRCVDFDNGYSVLHAYLERIGLIDHPFSRDELSRLGALRYWDGREFVSAPTPNRLGRWAGQGID